MADKHLNIFYQYKEDERDNFIENNMTRAILVTFNYLNSSRKIDFINGLLEGKKDCFLEKGKEYCFDIELQERRFVERLSNMDDNKKFLIGFCPDGKVEGEDDLNSIAKKIEDAFPNAENNNPDACIIVRKGKKDLYALVFENKLQDLFAGQLKGHLVSYMKITSSDYFKNSLIIRNYSEIISLFKIDNKLEFDLVSYIRDSGRVKLNDYKEAKQIDIRKNLVNDLNRRVLMKVYNENNGVIDDQKGWGPIINIEKKNKFIKMIGLVYNESKDTVELVLRFAPTMVMARLFYKNTNISNESIKKNCFNGDICFTYLNGYIRKNHEMLRVFIKNDKIVDYYKLIKEYANDAAFLKMCSKKELIKKVSKVCDELNLSFDCKKLLENDSRNDEKFCICPAFSYVKTWNIDDLYLIDDLAKEVKRSIEECEKLLGVKIKY